MVPPPAPELPALPAPPIPLYPNPPIPAEPALPGLPDAEDALGFPGPPAPPAPPPPPAPPTPPLPSNLMVPFMWIFSGANKIQVLTVLQPVPQVKVGLASTVRVVYCLTLSVSDNVVFVDIVDAPLEPLPKYSDGVDFLIHYPFLLLYHLNPQSLKDQ